MKKISVIIPCHNAAAYLEKCWDSIKNQVMGIDDIECIFVDDASDDNGATWNELKRIEAQEPESVILIKLDQNMRQGGARNVGMEYMSGEYLLFLDADDQYRQDAFIELYECAQRNHADFIQFDHEVTWQNTYEYSPLPADKKAEELLCVLDDSETRKMFLTGIAGSYGCTNKMYNVDFLRMVNSRFAEHVVYEEPLFVYPLFLYAERIVIVEKAYYIWHKHSGSTMTSELGIRLMEHPKVQLDLLYEIRERGQIYFDYKDEIDFHFFYSFMYETLLFHALNHGNATVEDCEKLKRILLYECSDITNNRYLVQDKRLYDLSNMIKENNVSSEKWRRTIEEAVRIYKES